MEAESPLTPPVHTQCPQVYHNLTVSGRPEANRQSITPPPKVIPPLQASQWLTCATRLTPAEPQTRGNAALAPVGAVVLEAAGGSVLTLEGERLAYGKDVIRNPHFIAQGVIP